MQKITQPLLEAASSVVRRTQIWDKFQVFVQRIKDAIGFGVSDLTACFLTTDTNTILQ
jgi:hypothetical protein